MSVTIQFRITNAGRAAAWNANSTGVDLALTHIQLGSGNRVPGATDTALVNPQQLATIASGFSVSDSQIRMSAIFSGLTAYTIREVGIWAGNPGSGGILFGYWSQASGDLAVKSAGVDLVFSHDMVLDAAIPPGSVTITVDTAQGALIANHEADGDPHPQYATKVGVQGVIYSSANAGGTVNAITASFAPAIASLVNGMTLFVRAAGANTATNPTFSPNGITAKTIVKGNNLALVAGDIAAAGYWMELKYDLSTDRWALVNPATGHFGIATAANDPSRADNSAKPASTNWIRGAMSVITNALGFSVSLSVNGFIKFPSYLGGIMFVWAIGAYTVTGDQQQTIVFPNTFNAVMSVMVSTLAYSSISSDMWFQETSVGVSSCTVVSQWNGGGSIASGAQPRILVIGY